MAAALRRSYFIGHLRVLKSVARRAALFITVLIVQTSGFDTQRQLRAHLLQGYDRYIHPFHGTGSATEVHLQVHVADIWSIDQKTMTFFADLYIRERWNDTRLSYSNLTGATRFGRVDLVRSMDSVWRAALYFPSAISAVMSDELLFLYPDGSIWASRRMIMQFKCTMQFQAIPYDSQECPIHLEMFSQTTEEAILTCDAASGVTSIRDNEWSDFSAENVDGVHVYSTGRYAYCSVLIHMSRKMAGYRRKAIVPVVMFVVLSLSGYWISPASAPARVTLAIVSVLIALTQFNNVISSMPLVAYPVWLSDYVMGCLIFNVGSVFAYTVINYGIQVRDRHKAIIAEARRKHHAAVVTEERESTHNSLREQFRENFSIVPLPMPLAPLSAEKGGSRANDAEIWMEKEESTDTDRAGSAGSAVADVERILSAAESAATSSVAAKLAGLDRYFRWIFPIAFAFYNLCMFFVFADAYNIHG